LTFQDPEGTIALGPALDREPLESDNEAAAIFAHADHGVGERAGFRVARLELPGLDSDLN
jgi:hypothetical protein